MIVDEVEKKLAVKKKFFKKNDPVCEMVITLN